MGGWECLCIYLKNSSYLFRDKRQKAKEQTEKEGSSRQRRRERYKISIDERR